MPGGGGRSRSTSLRRRARLHSSRAAAFASEILVESDYGLVSCPTDAGILRITGARDVASSAWGSFPVSWCRQSPRRHGLQIYYDLCGENQPPSSQPAGKPAPLTKPSGIAKSQDDWKISAPASQTPRDGRDVYVGSFQSTLEYLLTKISIHLESAMHGLCHETVTLRLTRANYVRDPICVHTQTWNAQSVTRTAKN